MTTGARLAIGAGIIAAVTGYMAYLGARSSWRYYLTVDECAADASELLGQPLRVSGQVAVDSLQISSDRSEASFVIRGSEREMLVSCSAPLPDNLAEELDVVVEGRLVTSGRIQGDKVLTRCASKYRSKSTHATDPLAASDGLEVVR